MTTEASFSAEDVADLQNRLILAEAEAKALRPLRLSQTIAAAGFDPDSDRGKVLADLLASTPLVPAAKVVELAKRYGWEPGQSGAAIPEVPAGSPSTQKTLEQLEADGDWLAASEIKLAQFMAEAEALTPKIDAGMAEQIAKAEADENWLEAHRLKMAVVAEQHKALEPSIDPIFQQVSGLIPAKTP